MKKQILKSVLCLSLSVAMVFGEAGGVLAEPSVEVAAEQEAAEVDATVAAEETGDVEDATVVDEAADVADAAVVDETADAEDAAVVDETADVEDAAVVDETADAEDAAVADETADTEDAAVADETTDVETVEEETDETAAGDVQDDAEAESEETDGELEAEGYKVVAATSLANVTGLAYNSETKVLSWNKVAGADKYELEISYVDGANTNSYSETTSDLFYSLTSGTPGRVYTVKVKAKNTSEVYQVAKDVAGSEGGRYDDAAGKYIYGIYDSNSGKLLYERGKGYDVADEKTVVSTSGTTCTYTLYKYPASAAQTSIAVTPYTTAEAAAETTAITALSSVAFKELTNGYAVFTVKPAAKLKAGEYVKYSYANNAAYQNNESNGQYAVTNRDLNSKTDLEFSVSLSNFDPGDKIYVKAKVYNGNYTLKPGQTDENRYSAEKTTTYTIPKAEISSIYTTVTGSSIRLDPYATFGNVTGFEYQRKEGKKWITIAKQGSAYTDEELKADTKYTYRVRGYSYNTKTKKTTNTDWRQVSAYTWGASLKLKAAAASATSVKLTWSKISNADGYEIYRYDTLSSSYNVSKGEGQESFRSGTLVKTIKKAKTVSYTDKKLTSGSRYIYVVRAYRTVGKNKCYVEASTDVTLNAYGTLSGFHEYYNSKGAKVLTWNKATGISGYKVEKRDPVTGKWASYKSLKKTATSITLPKVNAGSASVEYRIRSYNGKKIYDTIDEIYVVPYLAAVKNVKAVQTTEGVKVTWSRVTGADYYKVYRTTKEANYYDETTKTYYSIPYDGEVVEAVYDTSSSTDLARMSTETSTRTEYKETVVPINAVTEKFDEDGYSLGYYYGEQRVYRDWDDDDNLYYYYTTEVPHTATEYGYNPNLKLNGDELYNETTSYSTSSYGYEITGTSVVDKQITVQRLIRKEDDPSYNKAADPEYFYTSQSGYDYYAGTYGEYVKNADGSLKTETVIKEDGPQAGNTYYYYVVAYAKASNGADENRTVTSSIGCTKGAEVTYTNIKTASTPKLSSAKSSKKATVTITAKKVSGAKGYVFYRSTKQKGTYVKVGTSTTTKFTDTNVTGGKTYYYKVASYKLTENGTFVESPKLSAAKKVKVKK